MYFRAEATSTDRSFGLSLGAEVGQTDANFGFRKLREVAETSAVAPVREHASLVLARMERRAAW